MVWQRFMMNWQILFLWFNSYCICICICYTYRLEERKPYDAGKKVICIQSFIEY